MSAEASRAEADLESVSLPSRTAEPGEGISPEELGLAPRNHGGFTNNATEPVAALVR